MKNLRATLFTVLFTSSLLSAETKPGDLFTTEGTDFTVEELVKSGAIVPGKNMGKGPVLGSRVIVKHESLEHELNRALRKNEIP